MSRHPKRPWRVVCVPKNRPEAWVFATYAEEQRARDVAAALRREEAPRYADVEIHVEKRPGS